MVPPAAQQILFPGAHTPDEHELFEPGTQQGCPSPPQATQVLVDVSQTWPAVQSPLVRHWTQLPVLVLHT
jgi:hypothetical protein